MKLFAGIFLAALSMVGLVHQNTVITPPQVAVKLSSAVWHASGKTASAAVFNSVTAVPTPSASPTVVHVASTEASLPSENTASVVTASGVSPAPVANLAGYVTQQALSQQLSDLSTSMRQLIYNPNAESTSSLYASLWGALALSQRIDNLPSTVTVGGSTVVTQASLPALSNIGGLLGISQGGTGITTVPTYGQVLVGDGNGNYTLVATSSLGLAGAGSNPWTIYGTNVSYNSGNIGVGTTSASALFTVDSTSTTGTTLRISNGDTGGHIFDLLSTGSANTGGAGRLDFFDKTAGAARLSIAANGNVGVGTTTPGSIFSIQGVGNFVANSTSTFQSGLNVSALSVTGAVTTKGNVNFGGATSAAASFQLSATNNSNVTSPASMYGLLETNTFSPAGTPEFVFGAYLQPTINTYTGSSIFSFAAENTDPSLGANFTGSLTNVFDYEGGDILNNSSFVVPHFYQALMLGTNNGNGTTTGTVDNRDYSAGNSTAGAGLGGTINNYSYFADVPNGSGAGTTNNYGVYITENGGSGGSGTTNNYGIYDNSSSSNYFAGNLGLNTNIPSALLDLKSSATGVSGGVRLDAQGTASNIVDAYEISSGEGALSLQYGSAVQTVRLRANGTNYLDGGNLGIGTTTPYSRLEVWGSDAASSTSAFSVINNASTTEFQVFDGGNAQLAGTLTQNSDQRLKTNITSLDASSSLAAIDALNPVTFNWIDPTEGTAPQMGFIAQQVQQLFPALISTTSPTALTPGGTLGLNYIGLISPIVSAIQALSAEVTSLSATVAGFATSFHTQQLCVGSTCINQEQLANLLALEQQGQVQISAPTPPTISGTTTPPSINIQGDNPSIIQIGDTYTDLGAIATDNEGDTLGYKTFLNGTLVSNIVIDTTQVATDTIDYVATDTWGNTSTSTRTVIVQAATSSSSVQ